MANQEEESLVKAYDSHLMRRLLGYLRPYTWQVVVAFTAIIVKSAGDVAGPFLTLLAVDLYLAPKAGAHARVAHWFSPDPLTGIGQICGVYVGLLLFSFFLEF